MKEINIDEWTLVGKGSNGCTYASRSDENLLLKVNAGRQSGLEFVSTEFSRSKAVAGLGISTPEQYEIVKVGRRYGTVFRKISGKKSLCRICADEPARIEEMAALFSEQGRILHSVPCSSSDCFKPMKWHVRNGLSKFRFLLSRKDKEKILALADEIPDVEYALHGDFNPGNMIVADGKPYWIDLGRFTYGDRNFDLAHLYFFCVTASHMKPVQSLSHMTEDQLKAFWQAFVRAEGIEDVPAFEAKMRKYAALDHVARQSFQPQGIIRLLLSGIIKKLLLSVLLLLPLAGAQAQNTSFKPGQIWADDNGVHINAHGGGMLYWKKTYYWFGEHKTEGPGGNNANVGVHVYSSKDLYNWKDCGIALAVSDDPASDITKGCILERPKVIYNRKTKKFVMWFHLEPKNGGYDGAMIGIAQADKVTGPYTYIRCTRSNPQTWPVNVLPLHKEPVTGRNARERSNLNWNEHPDSVNTLGRDFQKGQHSRDMTLFVDDDGKAYHICSSESNSVIHISELTDDYLDFTGKYVRAFIGDRMEAPALFKKDGLYYFMGSECTGWAPNRARSAVAPSIWGPWTQIGNPCVDPDSETTYHSQSTFFIPVAGKKDTFIYMGDRWTPDNAIDGRYIWLPVEFTPDGRFILHWYDEWSL